MYVAPSRASEAAGEGLFAKTALGPGCLDLSEDFERVRDLAAAPDCPDRYLLS